MKVPVDILPAIIILLSSQKAFAAQDVLPKNWGALSRDDYRQTKGGLFAIPPIFLRGTVPGIKTRERGKPRVPEWVCGPRKVTR